MTLRPAARGHTMAALPQRIAVVGGGIAGLGFAAGLLHFTKRIGAGAIAQERPNYEITVFDQALELRPLLGGGFKLDSGAVALREIGLEKEYLRYSQPYERAEFMTVEGKNLGRIAMGPRFLSTACRRELASPGPDEPRHLAGLIMREHLQQLIKEALPDTTIQLDKCLEDIIDTDEEMVLQFDDGSEHRADLVVGADGIRSVVRDICFAGDTDPVFSGYQVQYVVSKTHHLEDGVIVNNFGDGVYVWATPCGRGADRYECMPIYTQYNVELPEDWHAARSANVKEDIVELLETQGFPDAYADLARNAQRVFNVGVYFHRPLPSWLAAGGKVVLMGDACHATTPFLGAGANQALQDAVCLAKQLAGLYHHGGSLTASLRKYEETRKPYAERHVKIAERLGRKLVASGLQRRANNIAIRADCALGRLGSTLAATADPRW